MKIKCYTLVEILMVVGIIAILVGLAIPVLNSARATAKLNKAAAECNSIALAIKNFEAEYGQMPKPNPQNSDWNTSFYMGQTPKSNKMEWDSSNTEKYYKTFFTMMIGYKYDDATDTPASGNADNGWNNNAKKIKFLDPTADYANNKGYLDPWGKPYSIVYRLDGEIKNTFNLYNNSNVEEVKLLTPIAVYTSEGNFKEKTIKNHFKETRFATSWNGVITTK